MTLVGKAPRPKGCIIKMCYDQIATLEVQLPKSSQMSRTETQFLGSHSKHWQTNLQLAEANTLLSSSQEAMLLLLLLLLFDLFLEVRMMLWTVPCIEFVPTRSWNVRFY